MLIYRRQAGPAYWLGVGAVCIDALPAVLETPVWQEVVASCCYEAASVELMLRCEQAVLQMQLILRADAPEEVSLCRRLERLMDRLVRLFSGRGFTVRAVETEADLLAQRMNLSAEQIVLIPVEPEAACYIPASYEAVTPLALERLSEVLMAHPGTQWSLHLLQAALIPEELSCVAENARFFAGPQRNEAAWRVYQALANRGASRGFFAFAHASGDMAALRELAQLHEGCGMAARRVEGFRREEGAAQLDAPYVLAEQVSLYGHTSLKAQQLAAGMRRLSFMATQEQAQAMVRMPANGADMHGLAVSASIVDRRPLPDAVRGEKGLMIGRRAATGETIFLPPRQLTKHAVVVGMPGSGKTTFSLGMLIELHEKGYPFLIIEPTKTEYRSLVDVIPELRVYTPGRSDVAPMALNPFLPPRGITLEEFLPSLTTVFTAAFSMPQPLDTIFADVLRTCYTRYGWRSSSTVEDANATPFGLHEFICVFRETVQRSSYSEESKQNLLSGGVYRLQSLLNSNPVLFDTTSSLPYESLLTQPTLIELDAIDNTDQKSLIMAMLLANLMLVVRRNQVCDGELKNVLMIDEAHLLLGQTGAHRTDNAADPRQATVQMLQNITVAIRAYGTGIIFADQSPEKLTHEIVDNANIKAVFRLDSMEQRTMIGSGIGLNREMVEAVRSLKPGEMFFHCNLLEQPVQVKVENCARERGLRDLVPQQEIAQRMQETARLMPPYSQCSGCEKCDAACRTEGDYLARLICDDCAGFLGEKESLLRFVSMGMDAQIRRAILKRADPAVDSERLAGCVRAHLLRRIMLICPSEVTVREIAAAVQKTSHDKTSE